MSEQVTFLEALTKAIQNAGKYNQNDQVAPVVILWPDKDRQWEVLLPLLRERLPLFTFGSYRPEERTGPAYWLRCIIARTLPEHVLPPDVIPIIYLPGFSKQDIRAIEETPKVLRPLAELQYRGVLWTHKNGRDWTVPAFIQSRHGGLGIEINMDPTTKVALQRALLKLVDEPLARLKKEMPLRAEFFDALQHPDEVRSLLLWLNDSAGYVKRSSQADWESFCDLCRRKYEFRPDKDGVISAISLLALHQNAWKTVWQRFKEMPHAYPHIPEYLRTAHPAQPTLFPADDDPEVWPQENEHAEAELRTRLVAIRGKLPDEIRQELYDLERIHVMRRSWVWTTLGQSPLAVALQYLVTLAKETEHTLEGSTVVAITHAYTERGWQADAAAIAALAAIDNETTEDSEAVKSVVTILYRPWLERAAVAMQRAVGHSMQEYQIEALPEQQNGTCLLFCDGLRYDVAQQLVAALQEQKLQCTVTSRLAALPTVTPTAKPAVSPVAAMMTGKANAGSVNFTPVVSASGTKVNADVLYTLLRQAGYEVVQNAELGDPSRRAWTELGTIDKSGHTYGLKLAHHLASEIETLKRRIEALLTWGWKRVVVITDHGWLLLPGKLPKAELPEHLAYQRKGRCAQLKELSRTDQQTVPWYWQRDVSIALAPGICCYEAGKEYEHGGLSPQECIIPMVIVTMETSKQPVKIEHVIWRGLRCTIHIAGVVPGMKVDIRSKAGDPTTSLLAVAKAPNEDGSISVLVEDEDRMEEAALIVVLSSDGQISAQILTTIGD